MPHAGIWPEVAAGAALAEAGDRVAVSEVRAGVTAPPDAVWPQECRCGRASSGLRHGGDLVAHGGLVDAVFTVSGERPAGWVAGVVGSVPAGHRGGVVGGVRQRSGGG